MSKSCVGCKWLYKRDTGYSNWTVENTDVICAQERNPHLPSEEPYDWKEKPKQDNWPLTKDSRCDLYAVGPLVHLDVDAEVSPVDFTDDAEVIALITKREGL